MVRDVWTQLYCDESQVTVSPQARVHVRFDNLFDCFREVDKRGSIRSGHLDALFGLAELAIKILLIAGTLCFFTPSA